MKFKRKPKVIPTIKKLKANYIQDSVLEKRLCRIILLALELSDKTDKEARDYQKGFLDDNIKL